jgi:hypothetical protein
MDKLTVVPVIPLALSEAMKTAMFARSASVDFNAYLDGRRAEAERRYLAAQDEG